MQLFPLVAENSLFKALGQIFHPLFVAIADALAWLYSLSHTYTLAIVLLTVAIMALLTPLTIRSTRAMLKMQALSPEMQKLRAKYKGAENRQQLNEEMMKLYREHGVSPTGGCLPMFLQMPAFFVLYDVIEGLSNTVKRGEALTTGKICHAAVCATPRYVPHSSAIYHNLVSTPGVMHSLGLNLAAKPLTHRANWFEYIPYFAIIAAAVALQYFQMAQMTRRNKKSSTGQQVPQQMQTMQRFMPLIFAYIYFLVPTGVAVYMVVSSAIRVLTQDMIFRYGLVDKPGERRVGGGGARAKTAAKPATAQGAVPAESTVSEPKGDTSGGESPRKAAPRERSPGASGGGRSGRGPGGRRGAPINGNTQGTTKPKPHSRSKSKRARKAR